jgi:hypothetical protein
MGVGYNPAVIGPRSMTTEGVEATKPQSLGTPRLFSCSETGGVGAFQVARMWGERLQHQIGELAEGWAFHDPPDRGAPDEPSKVSQAAGMT